MKFIENLLKKFVKNKTCFKYLNKPSYIDLIITNEPKWFQNSMVIETGLFGLHKVCITAMKIYYSKQNHTIIHYAKLKDFNNEAFIKDLKVVS